MADALLRVSAHAPNDPLQSRILGNAASKILEELFLKELNVRTGNRSYQASSLAVLSLCADLVDGYIAHELGKPVLSVCKKAWRKRQRDLLGSLPSSTTGTIRSTASRLKQEFRASLASSGAAGRLGLLADVTTSEHARFEDRRYVTTPLWAKAFEYSPSFAEVSVLAVTYNNQRPNMGISGITPAMKLKLAA